MLGFKRKVQPTRQAFQTYNQLKPIDTALIRMSPGQWLFGAGALGVLVYAITQSAHSTAVAVVSLLTFLYGIDLLFNFFMIGRSFLRPVELKVDLIESASRHDWPRYTIFCPLYKEASVLPQFIRAMSQLDYPADKLEVMLLLEEDDTELVELAQTMSLPSYMRVVVVPDSRPKTKPKACNYGLTQATGEYAVIYDAEDIPEPDQLKKAVLAFERSDNDVVCIQAKLNYYNVRQNLLTRLFTLEYSLWFDLYLTGLQSINAPIPLGGTSNHFRAAVLRELDGWDAFNVTEDADLGLRIAKRGYRTAILDSTTYEEANSHLPNWMRQRSRWIKGYMQTYLVHVRRPRQFVRPSRWRDWAIFQLIVGGKVASLLINPLLWLMTLAYFVFHAWTGDFIESLYLAPVFYLGVFALIIGNALYMYYYMMGAAKRGYWHLIGYGLLTPLYWLAMSLAASWALYELIFKPFYWQKTRHGLHLQHQSSQESELLRPREVQL